MPSSWDKWSDNPLEWRRPWVSEGVLNSLSYIIYGGFLKLGYPQIIKNWTVLVLKPMVLGIPHFRNPRIYIHMICIYNMYIYIWYVYIYIYIYYTLPHPPILDSLTHGLPPESWPQNPIHLVSSVAGYTPPFLQLNMPMLDCLKSLFYGQNHLIESDMLYVIYIYIYIYIYHNYILVNMYPITFL